VLKPDKPWEMKNPYHAEAMEDCTMEAASASGFDQLHSLFMSNDVMQAVMATWVA